MSQINAAANPAQAQQMIDDVMAMVNSTPEASVDSAAPEVVSPLDTVVHLPGGFITFAGEVITEAEVRELTGRDEEMLARTDSQEKLFQEVLTRGTVRVGNDTPSEEVLNNMLAGDRDYLLLSIFIATFGAELEIAPYCTSCQDRVEAVIDLRTAVPVRRLDSAYDRSFTVELSKGAAQVSLPTGYTQREMMAAIDRNFAELSTILLANTVTEIRGITVIDPSQVLDLSIRDRRKISEKIIEKAPGPQLQDTTCACPKCDSTLEVPLSLAGLFRL